MAGPGTQDQYQVTRPKAAAFPAAAAPAAAAPAAASPLKPHEQQPVDDAIQSLLGLAETCSGNLSASGPWDNWEWSCSGRAAACLRRRLTAADLRQARLHFPAPLFHLLFGPSSSSSGGTSGMRVVLQVATKGVRHFLDAQAVQGGIAYLLAGVAVQQLYHDLDAELADVLSFQFKGCMPEGTPIALCSLVEKAEPAVRQAAAKAGPAAAAMTAQRRAPGSPASPEMLQPATFSSAVLFPRQQQQQQQQQEVPGTVHTVAHVADEEPSAPHTIAITDALAAPEVDVAAVLAAAADNESESAAAAAAAGSAGGDDEGQDPDWRAKPKARGRSRKRRRGTTAVAAAGAAAGPSSRHEAVAALCCVHCGTSATPRWWKDNFPVGTLCNACGIWLKRHGYPRPVQFFINPIAGGAATTGSVSVAAAAAAQQQQQQQQGSTVGMADSSREAPVEEYYLINGRPKRQRTKAGGGGGAAGAPSSSAAGALAPLGEDGDGAAAAGAGDPPINFEAAGSRVFVLRRKLIKTEGSGELAAALVHFGWAPGARACHDMFGAISRFGEASPEVSVDEYELLSDCKAAATLQLRPGARVASWDALVRSFVDSL